MKSLAVAPVAGSPDWDWLLTEDDDETSGSLESDVPSEANSIGSYRIEWRNPENGTPSLAIFHENEEDPLWQSAPGVSFVEVASTSLNVEEARGAFTIDEIVDFDCTEQTVASIDSGANELLLSGTATDSDEEIRTNWELEFTEPTDGQLQFEARAPDQEFDRVRLQYETTESESFYGFGHQYTNLDLDGKEVPIISQEQGIGRGRKEISIPIELFADGASGSPLSTYTAMPYYLSSEPYTLFLENSEYSVFDLTSDELTSVRCYDDRMVGRICYGAEPLDRIEQFTEYTGRMDALPRWFHEGAIIGMQGGTKEVQAVYEELEKRDTPLSAFWLQDWVGQRDTNIGKQLWWNWELDRSQYPNWETLVEQLNEGGVEVLGYLNPYLADASVRDDYDYERNFYQEAIDNGYFVTDKEGELIEITITDFAVGIVDITDPEAREWFKSEIVEKQLLGNGFRGWMADFGEALPFESLLDSGATGDTYHNQYPVDYAELNREALDESDEDDGVFFTRSGYTGSQGESTLFWLGDQMVTWDEHDGFESMIRGLVSGGLSGIALDHSDIGGYTSFEFFGLGFSRSPRLLKRWTQTNAFTPVFRTHEGNQPDVNAQIYDDEESYDHFSRFAKVFAALADYRDQLMADAESKGYPLVRHPMLEFPEDETAADINDQFMLGSEFMIAPVVDKKADSRELYLPAGEWVHVWSGDTVDATEEGTTVTVEAPIGEPAVFYPAGSQVGEEFVATLEEEDLL